MCGAYGTWGNNMRRCTDGVAEGGRGLSWLRTNVRATRTAPLSGSPSPDPPCGWPVFAAGFVPTASPRHQFGRWGYQSQVAIDSMVNPRVSL